MRKAFLQLHVAVFLAGFTGILGRLIKLDATWLVWYRLLITSVTMIFLYSATKKLLRVPIKDIVKLFGIGILAAIHWVCFYAAIKVANVSVALVCFSAVGFFTAIFQPLILKTNWNKTELLLGFIVILAILLIFNFDPQYKSGIILGIISALVISINIILLREFIKKYNPETVLTYQISGGFLILSAFMPFLIYYFPAQTYLPDTNDILWLLVLAWICSVWAFQLTGHALKKLSAFTVNLTFNMEPVYGIILAFIVYQENKLLSKWFYIGFALIACALIVHTVMIWRQARKTKLLSNTALQQ